MEFDTNVENYTDEELLQLLNIAGDSNESIVMATQEFIDKYSENEEIVKFYIDIRNRLIKTEGTSKVFEASIKRGNINPDLKNTITRMVNIDSSYRDLSITGGYDSDNYVFTLNEPITNVISLMLYSIELPQSWYTFMEKKGNTKFLAVLFGYKDPDLASGVDTTNPPYKQYIYPIQINDGNYTTKSLLDHITKLLLKCGIFSGQPTPPSNPYVLTMDQDPYTGRCVITITPNFSISNVYQPNSTMLVDQNLTYQLSFVFHDAVQLNSKINYNLGWILGFRTPILILFSNVDATTNPLALTTIFSSSIIDTAGTKYVILRLDDYKSNRLNKSLVCINTKLDQHIHMPSYYNTSLSKFNTSKNTVNILPSAPNTLTAAQQYTINSISDSYLYNNNITTQRIQNPDDSDIFAKIPIKRVTEWGIFDGTSYKAIDNGPGKLIIEFSGPLQLNTRDYFGPVNMTSFSVSLYDDKGMILGLNGMDWSFTIIAKSIYQY
jgi:hypothetical protein